MSSSNIYDESYIIRQADKNDVDKIMSFIDKEWKKGHILGTNRVLFENEFLEENGSVNFMIAINKETGMIESIVGFLKASQNKDCLDLWDVMWKTRENNIALLGVELIKRRNDILKPRNVLGIGDNPKTAVPILKYFFKQKTDKMLHFYRLGNTADYRIAKINAYSKQNIDSKVNNEITEFFSIDELSESCDFLNNTDVIPYKDSWYYEHKFIRNPFYKYRIFGIKSSFSVNAIIVTRKQEYKGRNAIRIVDYAGDQNLLPGAIDNLLSIITDGNTEYIDFYSFGFDPEILLDAGFKKLDENDPNIIPDYFHPFVQKNIDIWIDYKNEKTLFFKADGDQDRPN